MKKRFSSKKIFLLLVVSSALFSRSGYGEAASNNNGSVISALNSIRASIDALVNTAATYIFQTPPYIGNELASNYAQSTAQPTVTAGVKTLNDQDIMTGLDPNIKNPNQNLTQLATIQASDTVLPSITVGGLPIPFYSSGAQQSMQKALAQGNENFNFQSLITPLTYSSQQLQTYAMNYIHFISGYAVPVSNLNLSSYPESQLSTKQKIDIQNSAAYQLYQVQRRQYLAQQSSAMSNLYWVYAKRMPIPSIKASDTPIGIDSPSSAQLEDYNATWRTSSQTWYTQMATASPAVVQRETLFILAELRREIHRMHEDQERLILMTAINQLGALQATKQNLSIVEKQVQDNINQQLQQNSQKGTTSSTTQNPSTESQSQQTQAEKIKQFEKNVQQGRIR